MARNTRNVKAVGTRTFAALIFVSGLSLLAGAAAQAADCQIAGTWKSNEALTLKNMEKAQLTDSQKQLMSKGFFGRRMLNYTCKRVVSTFDDTMETHDFVRMAEDGNVVTMTYYDQRMRSVHKTMVTISGNCYSIPIEEFGFDEVFCRFKPAP